MTTSVELLRALRAVCDPANNLLILHASVPKLVRQPATGLKGVFLGAVRAMLREGKSLMLPAFTFAFTKGESFHVDRTPAATGQLANWVREMPEFRRTPNPIFSFLVAGPLADRLLDCDHTNAYGPDSPFAAMETLGGQVVMLGAEWDFCSFLHRLEQEHAVPYREWTTFEGQADFGAGPVTACTRVFVRRSDIATELDFGAAARSAAGLIRTTTLWDGTVESVAVRALATQTRERLAADPYFLLKEPRAVEKAVCTQAARDVNPEFRLAVLCASNCHLVTDAVREKIEELVPLRRVSLYANHFGQMYADLENAQSALHAFKPDCTVFLNRVEDLLGTAHPEFVQPEEVEVAFRRYEDAIAAYKRDTGVPLIVANFTGPATSWNGSSGNREADGARAQSSAANDRLRNMTWGELDVILDLATAVGPVPLTDPRLWYLGRIPFSAEATTALAGSIASVVAGVMGQTIRVIVTDLDNTLWGGVLGEDGLAGLRLGGDFPGNAFADFQRSLKRLRERGVVLALCSKNDEWNAIDAMTSHREMILRPDDFAAIKINWELKSTNVRAIATELGISPAHVLFIDDNPSERNEVRRSLPDVHVLDMPADPALYTQALAAFPLLECAHINVADRGRAQAYAIRATLEEKRAKYARPEDFWASLGTRVTLDRLSEDTVCRAAQLMSKTNQFNTSVRRYGPAALKEIEDTWGQVWVLGAADSHSGHELLGVLVLDSREAASGVLGVDNFLLSCRALGRGVETGVLAHLLYAAQRAGFLEVRVDYVPTDRNSVVRVLFNEWKIAADGSWRRNLGGEELTPPRWIEFDQAVSFDFNLTRIRTGAIHDR